MVEDIEHFRPELEPSVFAHREVLLERHIPLLQARSAHRVLADVAERAVGRVDKCASVEERAGDTRLAVGVLSRHRIRPLLAVGVGEVGIGIGHGVPGAIRNSGDTGEFPIAEHRVGELGRSRSEVPFVAVRQLPNVIEYETAPDIEVQVAVLPFRVLKPPEAVVVLRAQIGIGGIA